MDISFSFTLLITNIIKEIVWPLHNIYYNSYEIYLHLTIMYIRWVLLYLNVVMYQPIHPYSSRLFTGDGVIIQLPRTIEGIRNERVNYDNFHPSYMAKWGVVS